MDTRLAHGCAIVLLDDRLGAVLPVAAVPALRAADAVYAASGLARDSADALGAAAAPEVDELLDESADRAVVLIAPDVEGPQAHALRDRGAAVIAAEPPTGVELLDAVTVMDRLRSPGGCPWDAEQDHDSLRRYLVEETYELLDAIAQGDREELREELGDVLLQVLFHARVAAEDPADPFDIDVVAARLVSKLVSRHPHVFADDETLHDSESQQLRWEELKQREKKRKSTVDGVALGQPAVALAAKLAQRVQRADFPAELLPRGEDTGAALFALAARGLATGTDPEDALRGVALAFADRVRAAEERAATDGIALDSAARWREYFAAS